MPAPGPGYSKVPKGLAFGIDDHFLIRDWADLHDFLAPVRLDHGVAGEEYEEVIGFHSGVSPMCQLIMWRSLDAVFVQPLLGRAHRYDSVCEALAAMLTKCIVVSDITPTTWPDSRL